MRLQWLIPGSSNWPTRRSQEGKMIDKVQIFLMLAGISLMGIAGFLGFGSNNWLAAMVLVGVGYSTFIVGSQHDR